MHQMGLEMVQIQSDKARIIDIALQADVSTATVDRVLNNRPGVSAKTKEKVADAIHWLNNGAMRPRIIPSIAKNIVIDTVISGGAGFANEMLGKELHRVGKERGIILRPAYPKRMDPHAELEALRAAFERKSSGIIVQALDHPLIREMIAEIKNAGIPLVSILTSLPDAPVLGYIGLDNRAAGRSAGLLMGRLIRNSGKIAIFVGGSLYRSHEEREIGFQTILRQESPEFEILTPFQGQDDPQKNYEMAIQLLEKTPDLRGIYNLGGGNRGIEKALIETGRDGDVTYIAFNLTPLTKQALIAGTMDAVIHQNMALAAEMSIDSLINHLIGRPLQITNIPVEIIMRENLR
jgi:LacI family transcriptional regulator